MEDKKLKDMTEEELEDFMRGIKWQRFLNWVRNLDEDECAQKDIEEISKHAGVKKTAPIAMMAAGFFAGVEVGVEITRKFLDVVEKEKSPANAPTLTGQP